MKPSKVRYQLFLDPAASARLEALAARPGLSKSAVLVDALNAWLNRHGTNELDNRFERRLNRMSLQLNRIERDLGIVLESQYLFVRMTMLRDAHLPDSDNATRALARDRFEQFVEEVGRRLAARRQPIAADADGEAA